MIAVKGNVEYTIDESEKKSFIESGYDIYSDNGKKLADGKHKTIPYSKYKELAAKYDDLVKSQISEKSIDDLNKQIEDKDKELDKANKQIEDLNKKLEKANKQIEDLNKKLEK